MPKSFKSNTLPKLSSKNAQPKPKLSFDQSCSTPLKNQQALVLIPSRLCCKLKTCNDVRYKIKSPKTLESMKSYINTHLCRNFEVKTIHASFQAQNLKQSFNRSTKHQVIATLGLTTYASTSNLKTESRGTLYKQRL